MSKVDEIKKNAEQTGGTEQRSNMCKPVALNRTEFVESNHTKTSMLAYGKYDKRVALTATPKSKNYSTSLFAEKIEYVLGRQTMNPEWVLPDKSFYGLLRNALGGSAGLIFPYTPKISFNTQVNYENTSIIHSNIEFNSYKNTPPPSINITADFSADNRENALHMLSAIWFISACSKCEFGENGIHGENKYAGLPPPILYLSGYNSLIDDIPVVISSYNYELPNSAHYVNLILDLSKRNDGESGFLYENVYKTSVTTKTPADKTKTGGPTLPLPSTTNTIELPGDGGIPLSFWLPMSLSMTIQLKIQQNLLKTRKQWSLEAYKSGYLMTTKGKNEQKEGKLLLTDTIEMQESDMCQPTTETIDFIPSGWTW